ncbi:MAG: ATP-binding protein [Clostridia bacterium]|nr:ATP-binding protein [Clostridia bacterium]
MSQQMDALLAATADAAPGGLYRLREDGFVLEYANRGYRELTGYDPEAVGRKFAGDALRIVHPADRKQARRELRQQVALHPDQSYDLEYRVVCADGTVLHVNDRGSLVADAAGGGRYLCGMLLNIDDTYAAQRRLQAAQEELVEANRAKNDFLAHMSHEIRTPIHAVSGLADLLLLSGTLPSEPYAHAMGIKSAAQTLMYLVNDILDFSKIAAGRMPIIQAPFHTVALLDDLCVQTGLRARGKSIALRADIDPALPQALIGDELRLKQVLLNLLTNAVKFTDRGSVSLSMRYRPEGERARVAYAVEDTGVGIGEEDQRRLFEQFRQLDPARDRKQEGTGLGLAISRQLVRLMGGDIAVESRPGQGSRFSFSIVHAVENAAPVARVQHAKRKRLLVCSGEEAFAARALELASELGVEAARVRGFRTECFTHLLVEGAGEDARAWAGAALTAGTYRASMQGDEVQPAPPPGDALLSPPLHAPSLAAFLNNALARHAEGAQRNEQLAELVFSTREASALIVDDNPANLLVGSSLLRLYGMEVREAGSGRQALEWVGRRRFDIVLIDHMMPEMSGLETVRALRAQGAHGALPVVVLTANLPAETQAIYRGVDIQGILTKPLELGKLSDLLLRLLPQEKIVPGGPNRAEEAPRAIDARNLLRRVPLLDCDVGMLHCAGDEALYLTLLFALCQDLAEKHALLERALGEGDLPSVALCAHSLKSALHSVGCPALAEEALAVEGLAKAGGEAGLTGLKADLPLFLQHIDAFRAALRAQLQRLPRETQMEFALPTFER